MKLKDIVYAAMTEDYSTANNIFGSELISRIENKLEERKISLVQEKWGLGDYIKAIGIAGSIAGAAVKLPGAVAGMREAGRWTKLSNNLEKMRRWFPSAKAGDEVLLTFQGMTGGIPNNQYISYEEINLILNAIGTTRDNDEKMLIVNGLDGEKQIWDNIIQMSLKIAQRNGDLDRVNAYQNRGGVSDDTIDYTQFAHYEHKRGLSLTERPMEWDKFEQSVGTAINSVDTIAKGVGDAADLRSQVNNREHVAAMEKQLKILNDSNSSSEEKKLAVAKLRGIKSFLGNDQESLVTIDDAISSWEREEASNARDQQQRATDAAKEKTSNQDKEDTAFEISSLIDKLSDTSLSREERQQAAADIQQYERSDSSASTALRTHQKSERESENVKKEVSKLRKKIESFARDKGTGEKLEIAVARKRLGYEGQGYIDQGTAVFLENVFRNTKNVRDFENYVKDLVGLSRFIQKMKQENYRKIKQWVEPNFIIDRSKGVEDTQAEQQRQFNMWMMDGGPGLWNWKSDERVGL